MAFATHVFAEQTGAGALHCAARPSRSAGRVGRAAGPGAAQAGLFLAFTAAGFCEERQSARCPWHPSSPRQLRKRSSTPEYISMAACVSSVLVGPSRVRQENSLLSRVWFASADRSSKRALPAFLAAFLFARASFWASSRSGWTTS